MSPTLPLSRKGAKKEDTSCSSPDKGRLGGVSFSDHWQRIATHFNTLYGCNLPLPTDMRKGKLKNRTVALENVASLRAIILQLAVTGKLVPQDPNDEPASVLLEKIVAEKELLILEGKLKRQKPLPAIDDDEKSFELPNGWEWVRFSEVANVKSELVRPETHLMLRQIAPDCIEKGSGKILESRTVAEAGVRGPNNRFYAGQILYSKIRPSLSKAILVDFDGLCSADMYPLDVFINSGFLLYQILSELFLIQVRIAENRIKMPKINQEALSMFVLSLPPLAEQQAIVSKVDELMALCDRLETLLDEQRQVVAEFSEAAVQAVT